MLDATIVDRMDFAKDGIYDVTLKGTFEVHGVKKEIEIKGKLAIKNGQPSNATAEFNIALADYNIKIPTLVIAKVAKVVKVDVNFDFRKYQGNIYACITMGKGNVINYPNRLGPDSFRLIFYFL